MNKNKKGLIRTLSLFVLVFSGMGVQLFAELPGRILVFTLVIFLMNRYDVMRIRFSIWMKMIVISTLYIIFCYLKGVQPFWAMIVGWYSALFALSPYINGCNTFVADFYRLTNFCVYYTILHLAVQLALPDFLQQTSIPMKPKTFLYLFYYNSQERLFGLNRIQGFCWEPSNWNLLLNMNLAIVLTKKIGYRKLFFSIVAIICTMSTTGIVAMATTIMFYYLIFSNMSMLKRGIIIVVLISMFGGMVYGELNNKLANDSGNARFADFCVALAIANESPLLGADVDNIQDNPIAIRARVNAYQGEGNITQGLLEREGMVNSFAQLVVEWGIPLTILQLILLFKAPILNERKLRYLIMITLLVVLMGTPISRTGFFFLFVLSTLFMRYHRETEIINLRS